MPKDRRKALVSRPNNLNGSRSSQRRCGKAFPYHHMCMWRLAKLREYSEAEIRRICPNVQPLSTSRLTTSQEARTQCPKRKKSYHHRGPDRDLVRPGCPSFVYTRTSFNWIKRVAIFAFEEDVEKVPDNTKKRPLASLELESWTS